MTRAQPPAFPRNPRGRLGHDQDNHDGVITHLEPDILECEVKWALESITTNNANGGDGIPVDGIPGDTKHNPANPQAPLKLDSIMSPVAGEVSREGRLLDLHTECLVSCCLQHCPRLLPCLCIWVRFSLICSYMPEM